MQKKHHQDQSQLKWISDFIWNIANDRLRDVYVRGKYRDVILPMTVLRRLESFGLLREFPKLLAYIARGEARPAYQRAFADQLAVFKASGG